LGEEKGEWGRRGAEEEGMKVGGGGDEVWKVEVVIAQVVSAVRQTSLH
jgi:hypothetical protein